MLSSIISRCSWILATFCLVISTSAQAQAITSPKPLSVVVYYDGSQGAKGLGAIQWPLVSEVVFSFAGIDATGRCAWMDLSGNGASDTIHLDRLAAALKLARDQNGPQTKLTLAVGGWTMSYNFSMATHDTAATTTLAQSCIDMAQSLGFDGVQYDWEYPTKLGKKNCPADASVPGCAAASDITQLNELIKTTRSLLPPSMPLLELAVYASQGPADIAYDIATLDPLLSTFNVMTYDFAGPSWAKPAFHSNFTTAKKSLAFFTAQGATKSKLLFGVPFYGYRWRNISAPGALGTAATPGTAQTDDTWSWRKIQVTYATDPNCGFVDQEDGSYFFCATGVHAGDWVSADSPRVLLRKSQWARKEGIGGMMAWEVQGDVDNNLLTYALYLGQATDESTSNHFAAMVNILPPDTGY